MTGIRSTSHSGERESQFHPNRTSPTPKESNDCSCAAPVNRGLESLQRRADGSAPVAQLAALQAKATDGGMPAGLAAGIESLSGVSMGSVQVQRNSPEPAKVGAHAFAQGNQIHLASGQGKHLPHEAWHVAQQSQDRVKPTMQAKGVTINDDAGLEREADVMGARAAQFRAKNSGGT